MARPQRVLVLANETVVADELREALQRIDRAGRAAYRICVPVNPVDTGQAEHKAAVFIWEATVEAAQKRLDDTVSSLRSAGLEVDGGLGDYRPMHALAEAVAAFHPDQIVICTLPVDRSAWLRFDVVERARSTYDVPVAHVIAASAVPGPLSAAVLDPVCSPVLIARSHASSTGWRRIVRNRDGSTRAGR